MKDIGFTKDGNVIVEMSKREYRALAALYSSVEGKSGLPMLEDVQPWMAGFDFSETFDVIRAYYETRFLVNDLQMKLNEIKDSINTATVG